MTDLLVALGLVLVLEGVLYALFPAAMKRMVMLVLTMPDDAIRRGGLVALALGVVIVWIGRT
ncbi:MAG: DUF2065 domain-containing protein [Parvibaculum sp.]